MITHMKDFSDVDRRMSVGSLPSGTVRRQGFYRTYAKRALDIGLILLAAPFVLPLIGAIALFLVLGGTTPFYSQPRLGRGGQVFRLLKIRTMVPNAEELLQAHLARDPQVRQEWDSTQKLRRDPRITRMGAFLRKSSLDELPQFWNVLKGEMSLIGPRPMMVEQKSLYPGTAYYALRPGISGSWQVSDRNESSFADRAKFDTDYHNTLSFRTDLRIFFCTFGVILRGTGC